MATDSTTAPVKVASGKLIAGLKLWTAEAAKAAARADAAKRELRSAKADLKKARKSSKAAKKAAKEARKKVEAARTALEQTSSVTAARAKAARPGKPAKPANTAKPPKSADPTRSKTKADAQLKSRSKRGGIQPTPAGSAVSRRKPTPPHPSAADVARSVIKRLGADKRGDVAVARRAVAASDAPANPGDASGGESVEGAHAPESAATLP